MLNKYQAIIFDMNGVIVDDEPIHVTTDIETCEAFKIKVPYEEWAKVKGWKVEEIFKKFLKLYGSQPADVSEMIEYKRTAYLQATKDNLKLINGVVDFIKLSRQLFPKVALATSTLKALQHYVFDKFKLESYFDVIVTAEDLERGKPDPDAYLEAAKQLGVMPEACLIIEDSINGVVSGKRAGATVLAITTTYKRAELEKAGADYVFRNFKEVMDNKQLWL